MSLCCFSCKNNTNANRDISTDIFQSLLKRADSSQYSVQEKIHFLKKADSLAMMYGDRNRHLQSIIRIATVYLQASGVDSAKIYFAESVKLADSLDDDDAVSRSLSNMGIAYYQEGKFDSAILHYIDAQPIFQKLDSQKWLAQNFVNTGIAHECQGNYEEAFTADINAARILDSLHDKNGLASAYMSIGDVMKELKRFDEALEYQQKALQILKEEKDSIGIAYALNNIGNDYRYKGEYQSALANYFASLAIKERKGSNKTVAITLGNIGEVYSELKNYKLAEDYFIQSLHLLKSSTEMEIFITAANRLSNLYVKIGRVKKAEKIALDVLQVSPLSGLLKPRMENNLVMYEVYKQLGQQKLANEYADKVLSLKDSLLNSEVAKFITQMHTKYNVAQKEKELLRSQQLQAIQSSRINTQKGYLYLLSLTILLLLVLVFSIYRSYKLIKRANHKVEILMKELNHRVKNNMQLISDVLHLQKDMAADAGQQNLIESAINRVNSINVIHALLYRKAFNGTINMKEFIEALISNLSTAYQHVSRKFDTIIVVSTNFQLDINKAIPIGLILNELITNTYKYANLGVKKPVLTVSFSTTNDRYVLNVTDTCESWDIQRNKESKKGLGLFLVESLVEQLEGRWHVASNQNGNTYTIEFAK